MPVLCPICESETICDEDGYHCMNINCQWSGK